MAHAKCLCVLLAILLPRVMGGCIPNPLPEQVANPTFAPEEGPFTGSVAVITIACATEGASIRYTLDGGTPSPSSGTLYEGDLVLSSTSTVKAIAYKEGMEASEVVTATYNKVSNSASVTVTNPSAEGTLVEDEEGTLSVACTATASGTDVQLVTADLSRVGGDGAQALTASDGQWTWSGSVTSTSHGNKTITFTATGADAVPATATATIAVAPPPGAPEISDPAVTGTLTIDQSASVTASCTASIPVGTVDSITVDLSPIGGSASQALTLSGDVWSWTGNVTPTGSGTKTITFTATGDGKTSDSTAMVTVTSSQPGTLAGAWRGNVTYSETARWGGWVMPTGTAVVASSVTFSSQFQPSALPVCVGNSNMQILIPTSTLLAVGDEVAADVQESRSGDTYHVTAVVTSITRTATVFTISLDLTLAPPRSTSTWHGPYTWSGILEEDDSLTWGETTEWGLGSGIFDDVTSSGSLIRQ